MPIAIYCLSYFPVPCSFSKAAELYSVHGHATLRDEVRDS